METKALVKAIKEGNLLGGAALDAFEGEEVLIDDAHTQKDFSQEILKNSLLIYYLARLERVIITPP